jgi:hypothetical protein
LRSMLVQEKRAQMSSLLAAPVLLAPKLGFSTAC